MAFIIVSGNVVSFADALDVKDKDQRLFESNEINYSDVPDNPGSLNNYLEDLTTKSTARICQKIRASAEWRNYLSTRGVAYDVNNIPLFEPNKVLGRKSDFSDMTVYYTLKEYVLPKIADFGNPESPEVQKIKYYDTKFNDLLSELISMMDWYDWDLDGTITDADTHAQVTQTRRSRGRRSVVNVR